MSISEMKVKFYTFELDSPEDEIKAERGENLPTQVIGGGW
jgi:hypothetical protein